jgi:phosphoserine phosphatase
MHPHHVLITVTGFDRPGVASALFTALAAHDVEVLDVEQVVVGGRLALGAALTLHGDPDALRRATSAAAEALGVQVDVVPTVGVPVPAIPDPGPVRHHVVVLGRPLRAGVVALVARCVTDLGGNIDSVSRLASEPVTALELVVSGADHRRLCGTLVGAAAETGTDIAVERSDRSRLAKRLVLLDVDSTLLRGDAFDLLAELGDPADPAHPTPTVGAEVTAGTAEPAETAGGPGTAAAGPDGPAGRTAPAATRGPAGTAGRAVTVGIPGSAGTAGRTATAGPIGIRATGAGGAWAVGRDGGEALRARAARLAGLPESAFATVRGRLRLEPGTRDLVTALTRLGFRCGAVSAAPAQVVEPLLRRVGLDLVAAQRLEVARGRLTGRLVGGPVDGPGKARVLRRFAEAYGVPLSQTVAVAADGDTDLLSLAGLGITLHPAPAEPAGYLDGLLLLLGLSSTGDQGDVVAPRDQLATMTP